MLGLIEFAMIPIPLVFYRYGHKIRAKSNLIRRMREDQEKLENKQKRAAERERRLKAREASIRGDEKSLHKEIAEV
jgi:peptidoglycan hydrolase CwlO-like protein